MNKIIEELFTALIKRIDKNEEEIKLLKNVRIPHQSRTNQGVKPGMASESQLHYIKGLGGDPWEDMTSQEAGELIEELKRAKEKNKRIMSDSKIKSKKDVEKIADNEIQSKKLSKEEIEEIGEEAFL